MKVCSRFEYLAAIQYATIPSKVVGDGEVGQVRVKLASECSMKSLCWALSHHVAMMLSTYLRDTVSYACLISKPFQDASLLPA